MSKPTTSRPPDNSCSATWNPIKPAAPVTSTALRDICPPGCALEPPQLDGGRLLVAIELHFDIEDQPSAVGEQPLNQRPASVDIAAMRHRQYHRVGGLQRI